MLISVTETTHMGKPSDFARGTLDLLVLRIWGLEPLQGWLAERDRHAKFYSLTRLGRRHREKEAANWYRQPAAVSQVFRLGELQP
jgi:hypothetical protein